MRPEMQLTAHEFRTSYEGGERRAARGGARGRFMRITKVVLTALLVSSAPIGVYAQKAKTSAPKSVIARSDTRELPADQQIIQALNRLTFGPRPGDVAKVRAMGLDNWIDLQLHPDKINDNVMDDFINAKYAALRQD